MIDPVLKQIVIKGALSGANKTSIKNSLIKNTILKEKEIDKELNSLPFKKSPVFINYWNFFNLKIDKKAKKIHYPFTKIYRYDNFLNTNDCNKLIEITNKIAVKSSVSNPKGKELLSKYRTSSTADLDCTEDEIVQYIDKKISKVLNLNLKLGESIQVQRYLKGEFYKEHNDYFHWFTPEYKIYTEWMGQRTWTFMVYLNDVEKGGETYFKHLGLKIKPKKGTALFWNNLNPIGIPNKNTMHEAFPPISGNKYVITKWWRSWSLID